MRYPEDESFTGLDTARGGRRPPRRWTGTASQRASAARGAPQAVFKITSYSHSAGAVWNRFQYVSREDALAVEGPNGERLSLEELEQVLEDWHGETEKGGGRRVAMSAFVSFPKGVDAEQATEAARQFFREAFADNHDYVFAAHRDTDYFHVHIVVQAAGHDGKQIRINRADIEDLRMRFAEQAAEQGIALDASPRWARGEEKTRAPGAKIEGMMRRWRQPELELAGAIMPPAGQRTQLEALVDVRRDRDPDADVRPLEYARAAEHLVARAGKLEDTAEKVQAMKSAVQLARFGLQQSQAPDCPAAEVVAVRQVVGQVDQEAGGQIRALREDKDAQRELVAARRPLAEQLAETRPEPERKWARAEAKPGPWEKCQALEYAKTAAQAAMQLGEMKNDRDRLAAIEGAAGLGRFGAELVKKEQGAAAERAHAREIIDKTERTLRFAIKTIDDPQVQKQAIQARHRLYKGGVEEYRAEKGEERRRAWEEERNRGRGEGWER